MASIDSDRFVPHPDLPAFMGVAHHKPAGQRRPPCLTRHVTLWMPQQLESLSSKRAQAGASTERQAGEWLEKSPQKLITDEQKARRDWIIAAEHFLLNIYDDLQKNHSANITLTNFLDAPQDANTLSLLKHKYPSNPNNRDYQNPEPIERPPNLDDTTAISNLAGTGRIRHETVRISGIWYTMPIEITIELHTEYLTLTTVLDLGVRKQDGLYKSEEYLWLVNALKDFNDIALLVYRGKGDGSRYKLDTESQERLSSSYSILFAGSDKAYPDCDVWEKLRTNIYGPAVQQVGSPRLGQVVADLRGIVLRRAGTDDQFITLRHPSSELGLEKRSSLPLIVEGRPFGSNPDFPAGATDLLKCTEAIVPLLYADPKYAKRARASIRLSRQTELSASTVCHGHGLHVTLASVQDPDPARNINPLTCITLMTHGEGWEIGRLMYDGNALNTLRAAAMYGFGQMGVANSALHIYEEHLNTIAGRLLSNLQADTSIASLNKLVRMLGSIEKQLADISSSVPGGLAYRMERSAYYRQQFASTLNYVALGDIPTFQNFGQIVSRRQGPLYEVVRQVGLRHGRIDAILRDIHQVVQTERTRQLLEAAEWGFWFALFPYYMSSLIIHNLLGEHTLNSFKYHGFLHRLIIVLLCTLIGWSLAHIFRSLRARLSAFISRRSVTWRNGSRAN